MTDDHVLRVLKQILGRTGISYVTFGALSGIGNSTARHVVETHAMPKRRAPREAIVRFVEKNAGAKRREDLKLV